MKTLADVDAQPPKRIKMSEGFSNEINNDEGYKVISTASSMQGKTMLTPACSQVSHLKWSFCAKLAIITEL